jgi:hypothetical protein
MIDIILIAVIAATFIGGEIYIYQFKKKLNEQVTKGKAGSGATGL